MSRRQETRKSTRTPLVDNALWADLHRTFVHEPHCFHKGCGQSTMRVWVDKVTGRCHPSHRLRRVLWAAVEQGRAAVIPSDHGPTRFCLRPTYRPLQG